MDDDQVELSNLPRQVVYDTGDVGRLKTDAAKKHLLALNPNVRVEAFTKTFSSKNAEAIAGGYHILVDGTDNLPTRYVINDLCALTSRPFIYGAVARFEGQMALFDPHTGPCYRCAFGDPPSGEHISETLDSGVFGVLPGLVGMLQAAATLKLILGIGENLPGQMVLVNSLDFCLELVAVERDKDCKICGENPQITELSDPL